MNRIQSMIDWHLQQLEFNYFFTNMWAQVKSTIFIFSQPGQQTYWPYLIIFFVMAGFSYWYYEKHKYGCSILGFLKFVLPKKYYIHPSAILDYKIFIINHVVCSLPESIFFTVLRLSVIIWVNKFLVWLSGYQNFGYSWSIYSSIILLIIGRAMLADFCHYWTHRYFHQSKIFWPFHRLHHSAKVMNPITLLRKHPFIELLGGLVTTVIWGAFEGLLFFIFVGKTGVLTIFGVHALRVIFNFFGAALRHTHIWISYGPILSYVFMSPAQHQIHHSNNPKHFNKNYSEIFALWDWIFGTLYIPKEKENLEFGLGAKYENLHTSLASAYFEPFVSSYKIISSYGRSLRFVLKKSLVRAAPK